MTININLTSADREALRGCICRSFDEGCIKHDGGWPSEAVMRAVGFDESHWIWSYYIRDTGEAANAVDEHKSP